MSAAKKPAAKKPAAKKPAARKPAKPAKKPATRRASKPAPKRASKPKRATKPAKTSPPSPETASSPPGVAASSIEVEARKLLDADAAGDIDNVFDIVQELELVQHGLPRNSELFARWRRFYDDCCRIMGESAGM